MLSVDRLDCIGFKRVCTPPDKLDKRQVHVTDRGHTRCTKQRRLKSFRYSRKLYNFLTGERPCLQLLCVNTDGDTTHTYTHTHTHRHTRTHARPRGGGAQRSARSRADLKKGAKGNTKIHYLSRYRYLSDCRNCNLFNLHAGNAHSAFDLSVCVADERACIIPS